MHKAVPISLLLLGGLLTACGDAAHESPAIPSSAAEARKAGPSQPVAAQPETRQEPAAADRLTLDDATPVQTILTEWAIRLSLDTVAGGDVAFVLQNRTVRPHVVEVRGDNGMRWRSLPLPPGTRSTLAMPLGPGTYAVTSTDTTYTRRGMRTALVVTAR